MASTYCRLCFEDCLSENAVNVFDDTLDINIAQLIKKYLLIVIDKSSSGNDPNTSEHFTAKICRMCFVHLVDFHYFFELIAQRQKYLTITPKLETIDISSDSEDDVYEVAVINFLDLSSGTNDECFHIKNEADGSIANGQTDSFASNTINQLDVKENVTAELLQSKTEGNRLALDTISLGTKFIYVDDDSEPPSSVKKANEENGEQIKEDSVKTRKRKRTHKPKNSQNSSIKDTLITLRRKAKGVYGIVDKKLEFKKSMTHKNSEETQSSDSNYEPRQYKKKKCHMKRTRSDVMTYEIIAGNGLLKCDVCHDEQKSFADIVRHFHKKHIHLRPYAVCCDKRHYGPKVLANHILSHSNPELFKCEICDKVLGSQYSYRQHKRSKHSGKRKVYKCNICGKRLISAKYFDVHVSNHY